MRIVGVGRGLVALAAASLAVLSLSYASFGPMGESLPASLPWREFWIDATALLLLAASAGLFMAPTAVPSVLAIGAYQVIWALIGVPPILSMPLSIGAWYGFCEAMTALVGTGILYVVLRWPARAAQLPIADERGLRVARALFGLTCIFYGWSHFAYADYTASMVPAWLPGHLGFAYFTGGCHMAAGLGILIGILPRQAAICESIMMGLFGLLVWVPSFFAQPRPEWATPPQNQWSELVVNLVLAASACVVATSYKRSHVAASGRLGGKEATERT